MYSQLPQPSASTLPELTLDAGFPLPATVLSASTAPELALDGRLPLPAAGVTAAAGRRIAEGLGGHGGHQETCRLLSNSGAGLALYARHAGDGFTSPSILVLYTGSKAIRLT